MRDFYANATIGMIGLLLFIGLFAGVLIWLVWPGMKEKCNTYAAIPLKDEQDDRDKK